MKVRRLRRSYIGICSFKMVFSRCRAALLHWDLRCRVFAPKFAFVRKSRVKRSFWKLGLPLLVKVSWKMLVLEAWIVTFGATLVENACLGSLACHFWWKSRGKCSFWKLGLSLLVKGSWKMLVLEAWRKSRGKCSFWKLNWIVTLGGISWCAAGVSSKSFAQECQGRVSRKECQERVSSKSVQQDCLARVSGKSVKNKSVEKKRLGTLH